MTRSWSPFHKETSPSIWTGRKDSLTPERFFQQINLLQPEPYDFQSPTVALMGFQSDEGVKRNQGRVGAYEGPIELRQKLAPLIISDPLAFNLVDAGNILCQDDRLEEAQQALGDYIRYLKDNTSQPVVSFVLGGGHETAWGHFQGLTHEIKDKRFAIINFDAHFDLRPLLPNDKGSSGTPFLQIADYCHKNKLDFDYTCIGIQPASNSQSLFEKAKLLEAQYVLAEEIHQQGVACAIHQIESAIKRADVIYLTICLDVLASQQAPGVSAPQSLGLMIWDLIPLLRRVLVSKKVVALDIVELAPCLDVNEQTSKLAANLALECLKHLKG